MTASWRSGAPARFADRPAGRLPGRQLRLAPAIVAVRAGAAETCHARRAVAGEVVCSVPLHGSRSLVRRPLPEPFDLVIRVDRTRAVGPLARRGRHEVDLPETYPTGV